MGSMYADALDGRHSLHALYPDGRRVTVPVGSWTGGLLPGDDSLLARCRSGTLDVGCGPGRLLVALAHRGVEAAGVDIGAAAVRIARGAGGEVFHASVFDPLPDESTWDTVLLADGNVGIGGRPELLLARVRELMSPYGRALVELDAPETSSGSVRLRLVTADAIGEPFDWAHLSVRDAVEVSAGVGLAVETTWNSADRWFVSLRRS